MLQPIQSASLKEVFIQKFEKLIFTGYFKIGEKLPPERELAKQTGVSRPVVHEGLVDLSAKGLVTIRPRKGAVINDFRRKGSLFVLTSLFEYADGKVSDQLLDSLLDMRQLFETENAKLAAKNRSQDHLDQFYALIEKEERADQNNPLELAALDFEFHLVLAMASENLVYPLLLNSMNQFYMSLSKTFFSEPRVVEPVFEFHTALVHAIKGKQHKKAEKIMGEMLAHGESHLRQIIHQKGGQDNE